MTQNILQELAGIRTDFRFFDLPKPLILSVDNSLRFQKNAVKPELVSLLKPKVNGDKGKTIDQLEVEILKAKRKRKGKKVKLDTIAEAEEGLEASGVYTKP